MVASSAMATVKELVATNAPNHEWTESADAAAEIEQHILSGSACFGRVEFRRARRHSRPAYRLRTLPIIAPPISRAVASVSWEYTSTMTKAPAWNVKSAGSPTDLVGEDAKHPDAERHAANRHSSPQRRLR